MADEITGYRFYYDKDEEYLFNEDLDLFNERESRRYAKNRLRMYANLYLRDQRNILITKDSYCDKCRSIANLQIDHILPITKGGKNESNNLQILCKSCNSKKYNK